MFKIKCLTQELECDKLKSLLVESGHEHRKLHRQEMQVKTKNANAKANAKNLKRFTTISERKQ